MLATTAARRSRRTLPRHLAWLLWLVLLVLPLAQTAAACHVYSHTGKLVAGTLDYSKSKHSAGASHCDLCLAGSVVHGGGLPAAELLREKLFGEMGEELPYRCEVVIESFKEEGQGRRGPRLRRIEATILVERDSQKPIVLGARGERLKRMASAARNDMEKLFGGKVYLGTWVKVRKAWTDDARVLRQLGYE